jgi:hypothetical protein
MQRQAAIDANSTDTPTSTKRIGHTMAGRCARSVCQWKLGTIGCLLSLGKVAKVVIKSYSFNATIRSGACSVEGSVHSEQRPRACAQRVRRLGNMYLVFLSSSFRCHQCQRNALVLREETTTE